MTLSLLRKQFTTWFTIATLLTAATTATAQANEEDQARAHFRLGRAHYDNGDFVRAAQEFEAAFAISKHAQLLYNIYLAYRDANVSRKAAEALRGYLEQVEDVPNRAQLAARLQSLEQSLANEPAETTTTTAAPTPTETAATTQETSTDASAATTTTDPAPQAARGGSKLVPIILMGAGGALVLGGVITGLMTSSKESQLADRCPGMVCRANDQTARDLQSSGNTLKVVTDVLLIGGLATAGVGVALLILSGGREEAAPEAATTASVVCAPGMCGGAVQVRF